MKKLVTGYCTRNLDKHKALHFYQVILVGKKLNCWYQIQNSDVRWLGYVCVGGRQGVISLRQEQVVNFITIQERLLRDAKRETKQYILIMRLIWKWQRKREGGETERERERVCVWERERERERERMRILALDRHQYIFRLATTSLK